MVGTQGVWLSLDFHNTLHVCRGSLQGIYRYLPNFLLFNSCRTLLYDSFKFKFALILFLLCSIGPAQINQISKTVNAINLAVQICSCNF